MPQPLGRFGVLVVLGGVVEVGCVDWLTAFGVDVGVILGEDDRPVLGLLLAILGHFRAVGGTQVLHCHRTGIAPGRPVLQDGETRFGVGLLGFGVESVERAPGAQGGHGVLELLTTVAGCAEQSFYGVGVVFELRQYLGLAEVELALVEGAHRRCGLRRCASG